MHKNHCSLAAYREVRASRQRFHIASESDTKGTEDGRDRLLGPGPLCPYTGHNLASFLLGVNVSHNPNPSMLSFSDLIRDRPPARMDFVVTLRTQHEQIFDGVMAAFGMLPNMMQLQDAWILASPTSM